MAAITAILQGAERSQRRNRDDKNFARAALLMGSASDTWTHGSDIVITDWAYRVPFNEEDVGVAYDADTRRFTLTAASGDGTAVQISFWYN